MPSNEDAKSQAAVELSDHERRELKQGLVAAVVGAGVDDDASALLTRQLALNPGALDPVIQPTLSDPSRLAALRSTGLTENSGSVTLNTVALLAAEALRAPFVAVSLIDEHDEFIAGCNVANGAFEGVLPANQSISKFAVVSGIPFIVEDATEHPLLSSHPLVVGGQVGAYACIPIFSDDDLAVGSLYAWDIRPVEWSGGQILVLQDMADLASAKMFHRPI
jgi:GAF domain-containing protein